MTTKKYEDDNPADYVTEEPQDIDTQEELEWEEESPEAFIPQFTVAPDDIQPPQITNIPTEEEQRSALEKLYKKIGVDVKKALQEPPQPITPEKERFVQDTSELAAKVLSAVMMWGFSIFGFEYGVLAPGEEEADAIVRPLMTVVARHSKVVNTISPDYIDITNSLKALSDYANTSMQLLQQIREDKARNNGQVTKAQVRPQHESSRPPDIRGYTPPNNEHAQVNGSPDAELTRNLTDDERRNYEALQRLSQRDYEYRARRSGRI